MPCLRRSPYFVLIPGTATTPTSYGCSYATTTTRVSFPIRRQPIQGRGSITSTKRVCLATGARRERCCKCAYKHPFVCHQSLLPRRGAAQESRKIPRLAMNSKIPYSLCTHLVRIRVQRVVLVCGSSAIFLAMGMSR